MTQVLVDTPLSSPALQTEKQVRLASQVANLFERTYGNKFPFKDWLNGDKIELLLNRFDIKPFYIFNDKEKLVGFCILRSDPNNSDTVWLERLVVDPGYKGQGLSTALIKNVVNHLEKTGFSGHLCANTLGSNFPALYTFQKNGFDNTATFPNAREDYLSKDGGRTNLVHLEKLIGEQVNVRRTSDFSLLPDPTNIGFTRWRGVHDKGLLSTALDITEKYSQVMAIESTLPLEEIQVIAKSHNREVTPAGTIAGRKWYSLIRA